jgi:cell division protein FtsB
VTSPSPTPVRTGSFTGRAVIVGLALGLLVLGLAVPVQAWFAQRAEIAALQAQVDATEVRVAELTVLKERWTDPAFIAAEARRRLHFVLPGEVGYVALDAEGRPAAETLSAAAIENLPWFEAVWSSVTSADGAPSP